MLRIDFQLNKKGYIIGSTVVETESDTEIPLRLVDPDEKNNRFPAHRSRAKEPSMGFGYVFVLAVAGMICLFLCINYLELRSDFVIHQNTVNSLEAQLSQQRESNDEIQQQVDSAMDLTRIYRIATTQLGMVYPLDGQVLEYNSTDKEYVTQDSAVPGSEN